MKIGVLGLKGLPSKGGAERVAEAVVRRLADRHEFTVYCDRHYTPADASIPGVRLVRLPTFRGKHTRMLGLGLISAAHALARGDYDLVHVHSPENGFVNAILWPRFRMVGTVHTQAYTADKWGALARYCMRAADVPFLRFSDAVTCVNRLLVESYSRRRPALFIPNGVDLDPPIDLDRATQRLRAHHISGPFLLFAAARIIPFKGCHLLLEAFRQIKTDIPLVIIGDIDQVPSYRQRLREMADARVRLIPFVEAPAELFGILKQARLFLFPSTNRYGMEGMAMALLEAASLGTPVLCSDIPQNTAVLGSAGYYFTSDDVADLRNKLAWALAEPGQMTAMAGRIKNIVRRQYSWDAIAGYYEQLYESVLRSLRGRERAPEPTTTWSETAEPRL